MLRDATSQFLCSLMVVTHLKTLTKAKKNLTIKTRTSQTKLETTQQTRTEVGAGMNAHDASTKTL